MNAGRRTTFPPQGFSVWKSSSTTGTLNNSYDLSKKRNYLSPQFNMTTQEVSPLINIRHSSCIDQHGESAGVTANILHPQTWLKVNNVWTRGFTLRAESPTFKLPSADISTFVSHLSVQRFSLWVMFVFWWFNLITADKICFQLNMGVLLWC